MGSSRKRLRAPEKESESEIEMGSEEEDEFSDKISEEEFEASDYDSDGEENEDEEEYGSEGSKEEADGVPSGAQKDAEMQELEKEYRDLQNMEQNLIQNLKKHKDEDFAKGQAIKSQKALWDKALELRFLIQKPYSKSNKLPQEPIRSLYCEANEDVSAAYSDLIASSREAVESLVQLQEALLDNNRSIGEAIEGGGPQSVISSEGVEKTDVEKQWLQISEAQSRVAPFRNKSVDKWQRKADVQSGAAAKKVKLLAFNQNISDQVATYMRDPSKMIKSMQMRREAVGAFGTVAKEAGNVNEEGSTEGDPELLDDSEFYQQLLKEFFETIDPTSSESAFYALKRLQTKKRKVVDRRASKSRKIRYNIHEKIVNFMAPEPMDLPPMAPKLFENLFGLKTQKPTSAA
ncbi:Protein AATF [Bienertia sinuspersici]